MMSRNESDGVERERKKSYGVILLAVNVVVGLNVVVKFLILLSNKNRTWESPLPQEVQRTALRKSTIRCRLSSVTLQESPYSRIDFCRSIAGLKKGTSSSACTIRKFLRDM